jgi:hypothetical protein
VRIGFDRIDIPLDREGESRARRHDVAPAADPYVLGVQDLDARCDGIGGKRHSLGEYRKAWATLIGDNPFALDPDAGVDADLFGLHPGRVEGDCYREFTSRHGQDERRQGYDCHQEQPHGSSFG